MSRSLLAAVVAAFAALMPAAAWAQAGPTLTFDQPCYSPGDTMTFSGTGFTPGGAVNLFFNSLATQQMGQYDTTADPGGAITGKLDPPDPDDYLGENDWSGADRRRGERPHPHRRGGAAGAAVRRRRVHAVALRGRRRAAERQAAEGPQADAGHGGRLHERARQDALRALPPQSQDRQDDQARPPRGECGDRTRTLPRALPRGLSRGRYELVFNTSASDPNALPKQIRTLRLR